MAQHQTTDAPSPSSPWPKAPEDAWAKINAAAYTRQMSLNVAEVERALLALDQRDRAAVIYRGLRSVDESHAQLRAELANRRK